MGFIVSCDLAPPPFEAQPTQAVFATDSNDFWSLPLPSDLRRQPDGTYNLDEWPGDWDNELTAMWLRAADRRLVDGWGVSSGIFQTLTGEVDSSSLPASAEASLEDSASVYLLDIDFESPQWGNRIPIEVEFRATSDQYTPDHVLAAVPVFGFTRRAHTQYALVLTSALKDADGQTVGRSEDFHNAFEGLDSASETAQRHFASLKATLLAKGIDLESIVGAAVFTTMDPSEELRELAAWAELQDDPILGSPWTLAEEYESYQVLTATYDVPIIQSGLRPYETIGEGLISRSADGTPIIEETQAVRLSLTVPKSTQPEAGFPLTIYMHGSGGEYYQAINRSARPEVPADEQGEGEPGMGPSHWLAVRGLASLGFDFPLHGSRNEPADTTGLLLYNILGNVDTTIDNFNVAAMELTLLSRLANTMVVDASTIESLSAARDGNGLIQFDPERLTAMGQSMGSTLGVAWATVDPRVKGLVLSGSGGILVEIATTATEPFPLRGLLETLVNIEDGNELHRFHPMLHAFQNLWDLVDPIAKAQHISAEPFPGFAPKEIMMTAGITDGYFSPRSQAALAVALGVDLVGEEVEEFIPWALGLAGRTTQTYPLSSNLNGKVGGVVGYAAPHTLGHYVVFNQDGARHQYTCFIKSVGDTGGAKIQSAQGLSDPCD
jgi:pimeloyl-ACP methyl ester carboxylesterase